MSTTSLKIPQAVKEQAAEVARRRGMTPHAFMVDAIERATAAARKREDLIAEADAARRKTLRAGKGHDADEVHRYLRRRASETKATRPKARAWRD